MFCDVFDVFMFAIVTHLIYYYFLGGASCGHRQTKTKKRNIGRSRKMHGRCVAMIDKLDLRFVFVRPGAPGKTLVSNLLPFILPSWYKKTLIQRKNYDVEGVFVKNLAVGCTRYQIYIYYIYAKSGF